MFGILRGMAELVGEATGSLVGVAAGTIAEALSIPVEAVKAAKRAGCTTYEEIREFYNDQY